LWPAVVMNVFDYHRPLTLREACEKLALPDARILAGGTDLIPQLREARRHAAHVVDLKRLPECLEITLQDDASLRIGAAACASLVASHPDLLARYPAVASSAHLIGSHQIQNRATLGGNICNAAPSADAVPPLIVCDAEVEIAGPAGLRLALLETIFAAPGRTTLAADELLTAIVLPPMPERTASHYLRFTPRREMDIAAAGVAARVTCDAFGVITEARIALASVAPTPIRARSGEAALVGRRLDDATIEAASTAAMGDARPISDTRASAEYRRELVAVLTRRVLVHCRDALGMEAGR
jgi:carbon-monoxide dehydrogenase medium subunit